MMKCIVICPFNDMQDDMHLYQVGDEYPREGMEVSEARIRELAGKSNALGIPLIKRPPSASKKK